MDGSFPFSLWKAKPCDDLPTPQNGAKACDKWLNGGKVCTLHWNEGYDFANKLPELYACGAGGKWHPDDTVPDCSSKTKYRLLTWVFVAYLYKSDPLNMQGRSLNSFVRPRCKKHRLRYPRAYKRVKFTNSQTLHYPGRKVIELSCIIDDAIYDLKTPKITRQANLNV